MSRAFYLLSMSSRHLDMSKAETRKPKVILLGRQLNLAPNGRHELLRPTRRDQTRPDRSSASQSGRPASSVAPTSAANCNYYLSAIILLDVAARRPQVERRPKWLKCRSGRGNNNNIIMPNHNHNHPNLFAAGPAAELNGRRIHKLLLFGVNCNKFQVYLARPVPAVDANCSLEAKKLASEV